jgi:hypothetical protein
MLLFWLTHQNDFMVVGVGTGIGIAISGLIVFLAVIL